MAVDIAVTDLTYSRLSNLEVEARDPSTDDLLEVVETDLSGQATFSSLAANAEYSFRPRGMRAERVRITRLNSATIAALSALNTLVYHGTLFGQGTNNTVTPLEIGSTLTFTSFGGDLLIMGRVFSDIVTAVSPAATLIENQGRTEVKLDGDLIQANVIGNVVNLTEALLDFLQQQTADSVSALATGYAAGEHVASFEIFRVSPSPTDVRCSFTLRVFELVSMDAILG